MAVMAKWNGKIWEVSREQLKALNGISATVELDTETNSDAEGSPPTNTKALKPQKFNLDYKAAIVAGVDPLADYESWVTLVGNYAPFFLGGKRFGPENIQLISVTLGDSLLNDNGKIVSATITLAFSEYAPEAAAKKATSGTNSAAGVSTSSGTTSAASVGATTAEKAAKKPADCPFG